MSDIDRQRRQARERRRNSLEAAYREERPSFLRIARRAASRFMDAEDVVQDAFVNALARIDIAGPLEDSAAWIYTGIRNRLIDLWRREKTHRHKGEVDVAQETLEEIVSETGLDPSDALVQDELSDALAEAIEALPPHQRDVITAQVFGGVTFRELAERCGVAPETLAARKRAAIKSLAQALRGWIREEPL